MHEVRRHLPVLLAALTVGGCQGHHTATSGRDGSADGRQDGGGDLARPLTDGAQPGDGPARQDGGRTTSGGGTSFYRRNSMVLVSDPGAALVRIAAQVFGLSTVEILTEHEDGSFDPAALSPPAGVASGAQAPIVPLALASVDVDLDGTNELLVASSLGYWFWSRGADGVYFTGATDALTSALTNLDGALGGVSECLETGGPPTLPTVAVFCDGGDFYTAGDRSTEWEAPVQNHLPSWRFHNLILASNRTLTLPAAENEPASLVYQSSVDLRLVRYAWSADGGLAPLGAMTQTPLTPPYVQPFDGFDHLASLNIAGCPPSAVGVGIFNSAVRGAPRQLQQLRVTGATTYVTEEIPTTFDVTTVVVVTAGDSDAVVAAIGPSNFVAYRVTSCDQWTVIAAGQTDFDWRAPPAPSFGASGPTVPKTNGVQVLGTRSTDVGAAGDLEHLRFFHYDGYDLRVWEVDIVSAQAGGGTLSFRKIPIHMDRDDITF
jgi:hypothetical protein